MRGWRFLVLSIIVSPALCQNTASMVIDSTNVSLTMTVLDDRHLFLPFVPGRSLFVRSGSRIIMHLDSPQQLSIVSPLWSKRSRPRYSDRINPQDVDDQSTWRYSLSYASDLEMGQGYFGFKEAVDLSSDPDSGHFLFISVVGHVDWTIPCATKSPQLVPKLYKIVQHQNGAPFEVKTEIKAKYHWPRGFVLENGEGKSEEDLTMFQCELESGQVLPFQPQPQSTPVNEEEDKAGKGISLTLDPDHQQLTCTSDQPTTLHLRFLDCKSPAFCKILRPCFSEECSPKFYAGPGVSRDTTSTLTAPTPSHPAYAQCLSAEGPRTELMIFPWLDGKIYVTLTDGPSTGHQDKLKLIRVSCPNHDLVDRCFACIAPTSEFYPNMLWTMTKKSSSSEERVVVLGTEREPSVWVSTSGLKYHEDASQVKCTVFFRSRRSSATQTLEIKPDEIKTTEDSSTSSSSTWPMWALLFCTTALVILIDLFLIYMVLSHCCHLCDC